MSSLLRSGQRLVSPKPPNPLRILRRLSAAAKDAATAAAELEPFDQRKLPTSYEPATFDPSAPANPPTDRVWRLVDEVSALTLSEVAELTSILVRRAGLPEPPAVGIMNAGAGGGGISGAAAAGAGGAQGKEEKKQEKTVFELRLEAFDAASKIKVIKEVRGFTDLGLKEAKDLVEKTPAVIKRGVSKEEAEQIIEKMKAVGAKVVME
ncbi:uncharacterized protein LOC109722302 [Ananas comosus]|uniref:Uncharacterized protein LOC109722302 n=2 Tax=Ananas comosus TaxID=4615 RepID=A0A6P5GB96_ANACO|nr:uncharacterized protein LOC109722302 [Ananas comosus]XP_020105901.1 uncharacterized protein LOC109722302 [Ananas comosus]XP_020105902.1 uncharacterized protein LOC109722302 [Ananas comosus]